jgi:ComF family protein
MWGGWDRRARRVGLSLVDALLDRRCSGCGGAAEGEHDVCAACDARIDRSGTALCLRCLRGDPPAAAPQRGCPRHGHARLLLAGPPFDSPLKEIVHAFKYEGAHRLAPWVAALLPDPAGTLGRLVRECVIVPVPLHPARRARRGFDQASLLAADASRRWGIPTVHALRRTQDRDPQARLAGQDRRANVAGAFVCRAASLVHARPILLVDDVATTGSTLLAAAAALETAGPSWILSLAAAHGGAPASGEPPADARVAESRLDVVP